MSGGGPGGLAPEQVERVVAIAMDLARDGDTEQLMEFIDHGLPVDTADPDANTLLMLAAYHGHAGTVRALLARGADPDLRNARDQAPIAGALFKGADEVVAVLRDAGADLDAGTPSARAAAAMFGRAHLLAG
ncbi:ankyrin repeat domain-containing protein [Sphaerimonospora sp. CA-214678]|uniref:ankyrin repeat domain-containing protein n=1 Tax=Sphaerimonospora sp. CA-214678 TaxID=3240029 RepID=UPI003D8C2A78